MKRILRRLGIHWLPSSQNNADDWHAVLLTALRVFAALQIAAGHLRSELFPGLRSLTSPPLAYQGLAFITGFAHQGVVLLFLISGYLVGGKLIDSIGEPNAIKHYAIDRAARLWTVLVPCLLLILLMGIAVGKLDPATPDLLGASEFSGATLAGNLVGLQHLAVDDFGGNYSLWTLAHQTSYYVLFPLLLIGAASGRTGARFGAALAALALVLWLPASIVLYASVWLLGALFSRIRIDCSRRARGIFCASAIAAAVYYRLFGLKDDIVAASLFQDLVFCITVLLFLACMRRTVAKPGAEPQAWRRLLNWLAGFTFTLYVMHVPLIGLLRHIAGRFAPASLGAGQLSPALPMHYAVYAGALAVILAASYLCSLAFEARTHAIRNLVKQQLGLTR
jgi:peptidoglycan/LPS O-acetylase OafA/YrhL